MGIDDKAKVNKFAAKRTTIGGGPRYGRPPYVRERSALSGYTYSDFEAIYRQHIDFVWRTLRLCGVPPAMLEDAAHEVFIVVHRKLPEYDGRG